jgi:uncharacterized membrane protein YccC
MASRLVASNCGGRRPLTFFKSRLRPMLKGQLKSSIVLFIELINKLSEPPLGQRASAHNAAPRFFNNHFRLDNLKRTNAMQ